ncbi:hypothetical protein DMN91_007062 [Ooceraea biroi]|uniref:Uncharacterized protein n=1 Tax=Ooceraea biroi TaxID=2015173 RepID=A0A3L8DJR9_OOCBI|nr:hypothetical protein DMN91_007062 [Ooceraea biroi]
MINFTNDPAEETRNSRVAEPAGSREVELIQMPCDTLGRASHPQARVLVARVMVHRGCISRILCYCISLPANRTRYAGCGEYPSANWWFCTYFMLRCIMYSQTTRKEEAIYSTSACKVKLCTKMYNFDRQNFSGLIYKCNFPT